MQPVSGPRSGEKRNMPFMPILEVIIGLVFIYLLLALLVTIVKE